MDKQSLIPKQTSGKQVDLAREKEFPDRSSAEKGFCMVSEQLLHPGHWKELCGEASASFTVIDPELRKVERSMKTGDFLRIDVPGPGTRAGDGYDWVRVTLISIQEEGPTRTLGIKLEPVANPESGDDTAAHFFKPGSSSTLEVILRGKTIEVLYHGRNEVINNETGKLADDVRNTVVGAGAKAGLSEAQWKALLEGLLSGIG